jgi:hypothetical protein
LSKAELKVSNFFFSKDVERLHLLLLDQLSLIELALLSHILYHWRPVEDFSPHHPLQNAVQTHQKTRTDLVKIQLIFVLVHCLPEDLVASETNLSAFVGEVENMVDDSCAFGVVFGHVEDSDEEFFQESHFS